MLNNLSDSIKWIESQIKFKPKEDLSRMQAAYKMLEIHFAGVKKIHVAGTNGKGSTCAYLTSIYKLSDEKVGTFQSPYILKFNERIMIDGKYISDEDLLTYINWMKDFNETFKKSYGEHLSFFEMLTLIAFKYFYDQQVKVMIMEVGIGGLLDATNIIDYDLSLITNIGFDHMKQLGNTLESIASNKLGIVKKGGHLITTVDPSLHDYFKKYLDEVGATYEFITDYPKLKYVFPITYDYEDVEIELGLRGTFQVPNSVLAIHAIKYIEHEVPNKAIQVAFKHTRLPGRFSKIFPHVYADGAHNLPAMRALVDYLKAENKTVRILFSALGDKDISGMLNILEEVSDRIILVEFPDPRFESLRPYLKPGMAYNDDPIHAFKQIEKERMYSDLTVITGSLHFVSYMIKAVKDNFIEELEYQEMARNVKGYENESWE